MSERVDFSANAPIYDRRHGAALAPEVARSIAIEASLTPGARVLDIGAGTGRVSHPFVDLGCDVVALDPSLPMLHELRRKAGHHSPRLVGGEGTQLPFATSTFDAVVIARLLYLVKGWRTVLDASRRVLTPSGCILHEWANGDAEEPWVRVRERARSLFQTPESCSHFTPAPGRNGRWMRTSWSWGSRGRVVCLEAPDLRSRYASSFGASSPVSCRTPGTFRPTCSRRVSHS